MGVDEIYNVEYSYLIRSEDGAGQVVDDVVMSAEEGAISTGYSSGNWGNLPIGSSTLYLAQPVYYYVDSHDLQYMTGGLPSSTTGTFGVGNDQYLLNSSTYDMYVESSDVTFTILNDSNTCVKLMIYDYQPKENISDTSLWPGVFAWGNGLSLEQQYPSAPGTLTPNAILAYPCILGVKPTDAKLFNLFYKINSVKMIEMHPAACHVHKSKVYHHKIFHKEKYTFEDFTYPGLSRGVMFKMEGGPAYTTLVSGGVTSQGVTYASATLLFTVTKQIRFRAYSASGTRTTENLRIPGNLGTTITIPTINNPTTNTVPSQA